MLSSCRTTTLIALSNQTITSNVVIQPNIQANAIIDTVLISALSPSLLITLMFSLTFDVITRLDYNRRRYHPANRTWFVIWLDDNID
jgi:hypothetical protein